MTPNEKTLFHLALCGAIFFIGFRLGQKKAQEAQAATAAAMDPTDWWLTNGGSWQ